MSDDGRMELRLEACVRELLAVLSEPGMMDVDEWKSWKRVAEDKARTLLSELEP